VATKGKREPEETLYEPVREFLHQKFSAKFGNCHLEITARGRFEETLKKAVRHDIIFAFLGKKASPDLVGFIQDEFGIKDFIIVEVKPGKITLQDIYQAKLYGDLFSAKYALLISPQPVPEEIKRLNQNLFILYRFMSGWQVYIGQWQGESFNEVIENSWFPETPL
jgi:hypothetical protein